jgi:formate dehydrogenase subunit delta
VTNGGIRPEVRLATEIADQFRHKPPARAAETIAEHIRTFWDPRMRAALLSAEFGDEVADPLVVAAVARLRT